MWLVEVISKQQNYSRYCKIWFAKDNYAKPSATRPWQHVLDPLHGYLILGEKNYKNLLKFSDAFNFGPQKITNMSVIMVCKKFLKFSKSNIKISVKSNKIKEHGKLLLNINKSKKILKWKPVYSVNESIKNKVIGIWSNRQQKQNFQCNSKSIKRICNQNKL